jgi:hypothetical protein
MDLILKTDFYWVICAGKYDKLYPNNSSNIFRYALEVDSGEYYVSLRDIWIPSLTNNPKLLFLCVHDVNSRPTTLMHKKMTCLGVIAVNKNPVVLHLQQPDMVWIDLSKKDSLMFSLVDENAQLVDFSDRSDRLVFRLALAKSSWMKI